MRHSVTFIILFLLFGYSNSVFSQLKINEVCAWNSTVKLDEDLDAEDWLEIYNAGGTAVNLENYGLSDDPLNLGKWRLPAISLPAKSHLLVYASGKDRRSLVDHWEMAVKPSDSWRYLVPTTTEPDLKWKEAGFNDGSWQQGQGGFGFGDGDDKTILSPPVTSVYLRKTFNVTDISLITDAILYMDYDDGFVAYLNGVEIARSNMGGVPPAFDATALGNHEARGYQDFDIEHFKISYSLLRKSIKSGTNVLAIQVHNLAANSSDLSAIPYLMLGIVDQSVLYQPLPGFFNDTISQLHTNFSISDNGEKLFLSDANLQLLDQVTVPAVKENMSYGRKPDGSATLTFFDKPTPGKTNNGSSAFNGHVTAPLFSVGAGFYNSPQSITLTKTDAQSDIHYTIDGSDPTINSPKYGFPINIDTTTVLKIRAFRTGYLPSEVLTNTYFINDGTYLPVISMSTNPGNLFDPDTGLYVYGPNPGSPPWFYGANWHKPWERPVYFEYFDENGVQQFEQGGGTKIHGFGSSLYAQKSLRMIARSKYGKSKFNYAFFPGKKIDSYKRLIIRNAGNDNVMAQTYAESILPNIKWKFRCVHFRDALATAIIRDDLDVDYLEFRPVVLYINGMYWGLYHLREKVGKHYLEENTGYDRNKVDVLRNEFDKHDGLDSWKQNVIDGSNESFIQMYDFILNNDMSNDPLFNQAKALLDIENFTDYFASHFYMGKQDWPNNNVKYWRPQVKNGKWRYFSYDLDFIMEGRDNVEVSTDYTSMLMGANGSSTGFDTITHVQIMKNLLENEGYKNYFINRHADLANTAFKPDRIWSLVNMFRDSLKQEMPRQLAKWTGSYTWWEDRNIDSVLYRFVHERPPYARAEIENYFNLNKQVEVTLQSNPPGAGVIKINTITPGPLPWSGIYYDGAPITITAIANPGYKFKEWTSPQYPGASSSSKELEWSVNKNTKFIANFVTDASPQKLTISEINYNPSQDIGGGDWIELHNYGTSEINLSGWVFKDQNIANEFVIPEGTSLNGGEYLVLANSKQEFSLTHPGVKNVIGNFNFNLSNDGEMIRLFDSKGSQKQSITYDDVSPWPGAADGAGYTLELKDPAGNLNDGTNWKIGCIGGSPGKAFTSCPKKSVDIVISEINYNSSLSFNTGDWFEIHNKGTGSADLSGWSIRDESNKNVFGIPFGTILQPGDYLVVCENLTQFQSVNSAVSNAIGDLGFNLSNGGEEIRIFDNKSDLYFSLNYNDSLPWPMGPDGSGTTLELNDMNGSLSDGTNWKEGCPGGSPGRAYFSPCPTSIEEKPVGGISLNSYPNPATDETLITFSLDEPAEVSLVVLDMFGKEIARPVNNQMVHGRRQLKFDTSFLSAGIYFYRLNTASGQAIVKKLQIVK